MKINRVALIGMGAMGSFFAPRLYEYLGNNFYIIAEGERKNRLEKTGVTLNDVNYKFPIVEPNDNSLPADLIIIATKGYSFGQAVKDIKNQVGENTIIMAILNGVDSEEKLIKEFGEEHVLYSFMRMSIVMKDGVANFDPDWGRVHFGEKLNDTYSPKVLRVKELFDSAKIPYVIEKDMLIGMWFKYMCNVAENQTCALFGIPFGYFRWNDEANAVRIGAMREVARIAQAKGINIGEKEIKRQELTIKTLPYHNKPSTLQDLEAGKRTEVEMFSGTVRKMGEELGIPTPINDMFYYGIKVLEAKNDRN
ncbi:MAG: ketopantoate reductase family protein [Eubacterium sp.]